MTGLTRSTGIGVSKFDEKTGELKDETTRNFISQQLAAFAAFIGKMKAKG